MSTNRKILKVLSIISLVIDILCVVFGAVLFFAVALNPETALEVAAKNPVANFTGNETVGMLLAMSILAVVFGLWDTFVSFMGIRGANNPSKMGFVTVIAGISLAISVVGVIASVVAGSFSLSELSGAALDAIFFYICYTVREEGKKA